MDAVKSYQIEPTSVARFAEIALACVDREFPYSAHHVVNDASDRRTPRELHPAFFGCFDWHSAVHSHWMLAAALRYVPQVANAAEIRAALNDHLTAEKLQVEADYFREPNRRTYERPYGWAWVLKLAESLHGWDDPDAQRWQAALQPLTDVIVELYLDYLPALNRPVRTGLHANTAFGLSFAYDYAVTFGNEQLRLAVVDCALVLFASDRNYPATWEPDEVDFLSPALTEVDLMRRVLEAETFASWLDGFLPDLAKGQPSSLLNPVSMINRSDAQVVHLDGLNLSRAWALWNTASTMRADDVRKSILQRAAERHADAGLQAVGSGDYIGDHWLGSFALYMLLCATDSI